MAASAADPRYAPEDPSLPQPWKGLVDGRTGYLYFWNPVTNITQYQRPVASVSATETKPTSIVTSDNHADEEIKVIESGNIRSKPISVSGEAISEESTQLQDPMCHSGDRQNVLNGTLVAGHGGSSTRTITSSGGGSASMAEAYRDRHEITVSGNDVPLPFTTYNSTGFPFEILREIRNAGFLAPTPIQAQSWPIALQSRDIVAIAKTGSGKTLGYLIPGFILLKRSSNNSRMGPTVLVLSPTRELATQIQDEAKKFGSSLKISCTCLYGGAPKNVQLRDLDRGVDIVVATPGRLNDILEMKRVNLRQVSYLVLDEADRMLDMGFEPQIKKIMREVPSRRQTLMFTATWPKEVRKIATDILVNPVQVNIGKVGELVANKSITQHVEVLSMMEKRRRLEQILMSQDRGSKIIIFCSTKKMCDQLAHDLMREFGASSIHGDKSQGERDEVLSHFRTGKCPVLVATDVAARGLDVKDIRVVINYDFPTGIEDYVHRIGRTGRAGAKGLAFTFFGDRDAKYARDLIKILEGSGQRIPPEIRDLAASGAGMPKPRFRDSGSFGSGGSGYGGISSDRNRVGEEEKSGWMGRRSRSRSPEKQERKSFHEMMMLKGKSRGQETQGGGSW